MKISVLTPTIRPDGLKIVQQGLSEQTLTDFEWLVEIGVPGHGHDLNAAYNRMLRRSKGELIVSLQDYIKITPHFLQNFWRAYEKDKRTFFTAPVGKVNNLDYAPPNKWDWRAYEDAQMTWRHWEIDAGAAPRAALFEIGGFDEELDKHWSCDNLNVGCRADIAGYKFENLLKNPSLAYDHDAFIKHPFRDKYDPKHNTQRMAMFRGGLKINYLE